MSFTLRNLFSEEDGDPAADWVEHEGEAGERANSPLGQTKATEEGQAYLVSELLPFIPPAIVASGSLPMEKEIRILMGKDGSTDVRLSAIFQQCPELFDAEITPLNDSTVTLPMKLGKAQPAAKVGSSIFDAPGTPFGAPGFGMPESAGSEVAVNESEDNPFWSPESDEIETKAQKVPEADTGFSGGFADSLPPKISQKDEGGAFGDPSREDKAAAMPSKEPKAENPFGDMTAAAAESKSSPFKENPFDSDESFSTLFSTKAEEDSEIPYPESEGDDSAWGALFDADSETSSEAITGEVAGLGDMLKKNDASTNKKVATDSVNEAESKRSAADSSKEIPPEPTPANEVSPKTPAISFSVEKPSDFRTPVPPADTGAKEYNSLRDSSSAPLSEPSLKVEEEELAPNSSNSAMPGEMEVNFKDLEFRAIFSSDDSFTLAKVARQVVAFDGVCACALATPAKLVQASRNEQSRLGDEAREMVDAIRNLAKLTGLPEARAFTLQTDRGTVSLFLEGDCCVTVNHQSSNFGPGVREKLILVARNIYKLNE